MARLGGGEKYRGRMRALLLAVASVAALAGCGGAAVKPDGDPAAFALRVTHQILANEYAQAWHDLHPTDQKVAPLAEYVACEARSPIIVKPLSVSVVSVSRESVGLGNGHFVDSSAVHVRIGFSGGFHFVHTVHVVVSGGRWTWILPPWRFRDYRADLCPTAQTPQPAA
jgi:hypothetical protein